MADIQARRGPISRGPSAGWLQSQPDDDRSRCKGCRLAFQSGGWYLENPRAHNDSRGSPQVLNAPKPLELKWRFCGYVRPGGLGRPLHLLVKTMRLDSDFV
ncbi:hypothetical protein D3C72_1681930 [compost metagenome]